MYQEDAERREYERALVENEAERRKGTGMVDLKRDDWMTCDCGSDQFTQHGQCHGCGKLPRER